jgi:hypothetical protein
MVRRFSRLVNATDLRSYATLTENGELKLRLDRTVIASDRSRAMTPKLGGDGQLAIREANRRTLGLARIAKHLAFHPIEPVGCSEESITCGIAHDDTCSL